jgi:hypothetical protein
LTVCFGQDRKLALKLESGDSGWRSNAISRHEETVIESMTPYIISEPLGADRLQKESKRRAKASGIVVKEELDLKSPLLELWQQNQRTREPNLR